jgi:hypothetical protein
MEDTVLFDISLNLDTHLWDIISTDPEYEILSEYRILGGNQFYVMQQITDSLAMEFEKIALFRIKNDSPSVDVIQIEATIPNRT